MLLTQAEVQRNGVSLRTELAGDLPPIMGDRIQLQQVVLNLLINAIEAIKAEGKSPRELWVSSQKANGTLSRPKRGAQETSGNGESAENYILVAVRDSGRGLDPGNLDRLFDAFYSTKPQGLGMGLAISRSIVEAHGGRLWATTNAPRGAAFQFTLPIPIQRETIRNGK